MSPHTRILELAAAALDFELSVAEAAELQHHLATCTTCRVDVRALSDDADVVAKLPALRMAPEREAAILDRALGGRGSTGTVRRVAVAALLALLAMAVVGVGAEIARRSADERLISHASPSPDTPGGTATPTTAAQQPNWVGRWLSNTRPTLSARALSGLGAASATVLDVQLDSLSVYPFLEQHDDAAVLRARVVGGQGRLEVESIRDDEFGNCPIGSRGSYPYTISSSGLTLIVGSGTDTCALRLGTLTGTWSRAACPLSEQWGVSCLGPVDAGARGLISGALWHDAQPPTSGDVTYTVPEGWAESEYGLTTAAAFATVSPQSPYPALSIEVIDERIVVGGGGTDAKTGLPAFPGSALAAQDRPCDDHVPAQVTDTIPDQIAALRAMPGLVVSASTPISIDGHAGTFVDIAVDPQTVRPCTPGITPDPRWPAPMVAVLTWGFGGIDLTSRQRLVIVDLGDSHLVMIRIEVRAGLEFDTSVAAAMPVVESIQFHLEP